MVPGAIYLRSILFSIKQFVQNESISQKQSQKGDLDGGGSHTKDWP
jgi:hypothetical protein